MTERRNEILWNANLMQQGNFIDVFLSSTWFGYIRPSSGALDVELQHMVFSTEFLEGWTLHGTIRTVHTTYASALKTTSLPKTRCRKPYAATQHLMLLMMGTAPSAPYTRPTHRLSRPPYLFTYSMVQSPSEANCFAASQEIPPISRNPKVHYRTHKRPPPVSILGQPNPVHIPTSHLLEIRSNIIPPSTPTSPQWSPSLRFPHQDPIHPSPHAYMPHAQPISFFLILSPAQYWVRSTTHLAPRYAISYIPPLPRPS